MTLHVATLYGTNDHHIAEFLLQGLGAGAAGGGCRSIRRAAATKCLRPRVRSAGNAPFSLATPRLAIS